MNFVQEEVGKILKHYTTKLYFNELMLAKESYISKTGQIDEEASEYESRMNSFNDWYLFNYKKENQSKIIDNLSQVKELSKDLTQEFLSALTQVNYSLFLFKKINFRKQVVIKDILHGKKFTLAKDNGILSLVEDDLFVGRTVKYHDEHYLLNGLYTLPRETLPALKKESKRVHKLNNTEEEESFLLNLERLKTRSLQYGHIDSQQIFTF